MMLRPPRRGLRITFSSSSLACRAEKAISTLANKWHAPSRFFENIRNLVVWEIHYGCAGVRGSLHSEEVHRPLSPTIPPSDRRRNPTTLPPLLGHILAFDRDSVPGVTSHGWITKETEPSGARCPCRYEKPEPHRLRWNVDCSRQQPNIGSICIYLGQQCEYKGSKVHCGLYRGAERRL